METETTEKINKEETEIKEETEQSECFKEEKEEIKTSENFDTKDSEPPEEQETEIKEQETSEEEETQTKETETSEEEETETNTYISLYSSDNTAYTSSETVAQLSEQLREYHVTSTAIGICTLFALFLITGLLLGDILFRRMKG